MLPKGAFAVAKMLDGVISQQESYDLEEVRVLVLASALPPYPHPSPPLPINPHFFVPTLRPHPLPPPPPLPCYPSP